MADFKLVDPKAFSAAKARGTRLGTSPKAIAAKFDARTRRIVVDLDTGAEFAFEPKYVAGLDGAREDDLRNMVIEGDGRTLRIPALDIDITISRLIEIFVGPTDWSKREARYLLRKA